MSLRNKYAPRGTKMSKVKLGLKMGSCNEKVKKKKETKISMQMVILHGQKPQNIS